jgi:hypothetical protein
MSVQKRPILVICEGPSERAYLQELNRYFEEEDIPLIFIAKPSNGGQYALVKNTYSKTKKDNPRSAIYIWVDRDRYMRNDNDDMKNYQSKSSGIPDFLFSEMNFEDFLTMHLDREELNKWWNSCAGRNHFTSPSHSGEYIPAFMAFIGSDYSKGEMPIEINCHSLKNLKRHQEDTSIPFKCDFADLLFQLIETVTQYGD